MDWYSVEQHLEKIKEHIDSQDRRIQWLEEENKKLKEEIYKDEELQSMKTQLEEMKEEYYRGFPITKEQDKTIEAWKKEHGKEVHGVITDKDRFLSKGAIGGRYSFHFTPTSIGTVGTIKCSCGAEFCFQEMW